MTDVLQEFMATWFHTRPIMPPVERPVNVDGVLHGCVLYRQKQFQVQLFIVAPNSEIPDHVHPNVDSFEVYFSGHIAFRHRGAIVTPQNLWDQMSATGLPMLYGQTIRVKPDDPHGGTFGPKGGAFLSVQHWLNGVAPSSVGDDWAYTESAPAKSFSTEEAK